jgi:hypothetical protein
LVRERKTVAKSFRINEDALEGLREEARSQTLSLNTLVNQLLVNHAQFGRYLMRMHALMLTRQTLSELINPLTEESIIKASQNAGKTAPEALITAKDGKITVSHVIELMRYTSSYSNWLGSTSSTNSCVNPRGILTS